MSFDNEKEVQMDGLASKNNKVSSLYYDLTDNSLSPRMYKQTLSLSLTQTK